MSGVEFLAQANAFFPDAKRALFTPFSETESAITAVHNLRIDDYLITPCHPPEQKLYPGAGNDLDHRNLRHSLWRFTDRSQFQTARAGA